MVYGRPKHLWSIYQKIVKTGRELEQLFDIVAFRVIVENVRACYETLGVVHSQVDADPGALQGLHRAAQAQHVPVAAHLGDRAARRAHGGADPHRRRCTASPRRASPRTGATKKGASTRRGDDKDQKRFAWLRQLMEWQRDLKDPTEFIETVKIDLFADEVYVFTPKGDVKALPKGAIPIDLAYAIHTEVGHHCSGARVNGLIVPLRYVLRNGDTVEIITSPNQKPNKDWLKFVMTSSAKAKIRNYLRSEQREKSKALGRELLEREFRKYGVTLNKAQKSGELDRGARRSSRWPSFDELLISVGYGKVLPADVIEQVVPEEQRRKVEAEPPPTENPVLNLVAAHHAAHRRRASRSPARTTCWCASPSAARRCRAIRSSASSRAGAASPCTRSAATRRSITIPIGASRSSGTASSSSRGRCRVQVVCADKPGLLAHISQSFNDLGVNISQANCRSMDDHKAVNTFTFAVQDLDQLKTVMRALQKISGVFQVSRM